MGSAYKLTTNLKVGPIRISNLSLESSFLRRNKRWLIEGMQKLDLIQMNQELIKDQGYSTQQNNIKGKQKLIDEKQKNIQST